MHTYIAAPYVSVVQAIANNETGLTLRCTSTGSAATNVTWTRNGVTLHIDGQKYKTSQTVTSRTSSTYKNELQVCASPEEIFGSYTCIVSNVLGTSQRNVSIKGAAHVYMHILSHMQ